MPGAGFQPAGLSPAGFGPVQQAPAPIFIILPDPLTGKSLTGRFIDPRTRQYAFTTDGRTQGFGTVPQLVQIALMTIFNQSVIAGFGNQLYLLKPEMTLWLKIVMSAI